MMKKILNPVITLALGALMAVMVVRECRPLRERWPSSWLAAGLRVDPERVKKGAMLETLNLMIPPFQDFSEALLSGDAPGLQPHISYYERIVEYMPYNAEAFGILGVCYNRLGRFKQAEDALKKAVSLSPEFFWPYHNLGMLYLHQGRYAEAADLFGRALSLNPRASLEMIYSSRIYRPMVISIPNVEEEVRRQLEAGYHRCYYLNHLLLDDAPDFLKDRIVAGLGEETKLRVF